MDAVDLARRFGLGRAVRMSDGPLARGKEGLVWRLDTADGSWAVKVPFDPSDEDEVAASTSFQEAAYAAGVPTPRVRRTTEGHVFASVAGSQVRVYEWVDLMAPDARLDPAMVGVVVAAIHRVQATDSSSVDPWYHEPIGADRWDQLVEQLRQAGAPCRPLAALRDELVALESWIELPQTLQPCHRDLWADNLLPTADGGVCVIDWENSGPADPSQELGCVLFEFARGDPGRVSALTDAYRQAGGPAIVNQRRHFAMPHRPARAHHRGRRHRLADPQSTLTAAGRLRSMGQRDARRAPHPRTARQHPERGAGAGDVSHTHATWPLRRRRARIFIDALTAHMVH